MIRFKLGRISKPWRLLVLIIGCSLTPLAIAASLAGTNTDDQKIQLLSNRFRVDQAVDKILFIIDRVPESAAVILVQPDGSKLYSIRKYKGVKWMDGNAGDMIEITNPQIGPWQIIGDILPSSEIRLATSLKLNVNPIPNELFVGEEIKLTSSLAFDNKLLKIEQVDDLMKHEVFLRSVNNPGAENFGAGVFRIGEFIDDGYGFDSKSGDGIFTGRLNLNKPIGNYELVVRVANKVFEREYHQPLLLRLKPIKVDLLSAAIDGQYTLRFLSDPNIANLSQMLIQVKITYPDDTVTHHSIEGVVATHLVRLEQVTKPGRHKVDIDVVGTTVAGRDFKFTLKQIKFRVNALPQAQAKEALDIKERESKSAFELKLQRKVAKEIRQQKDDKRTLILIAIMVNVILLLIGGLLLWLFFRTKQPKLSKEQKAKVKADKAQAKKDAKEKKSAAK